MSGTYFLVGSGLRFRRRPVWLGLAVALASLGSTVAAQAHAVVYPSESQPGAYEKYVLRVPNESNVATVSVAIEFPTGATVLSFSDVPRWALEVVRDERGRIVGAVWKGELPPARFVELPFVAVNPRAEARLVWSVTQTYADGEVVKWSGPEGSETPASITWVRPADPGGTEVIELLLPAGALLIALFALGLAFDSRRRLA